MTLPLILRSPFHDWLREPLPLMLATYISFRLPSSTTPAGYQAVGMQPRRRLRGGSNFSTATELFVPLETATALPFGIIASALGALPNRNFSTGFVETVSTTLSVAVSITETLSL